MMKRYKDYKTDNKTVEIHDLSFLSDRDHRYGWLRRHYKHFRLRRSLKKARHVIAKDQKVATDIVRYYFVPKEKITLRQNPE